MYLRTISIGILLLGILTLAACASGEVKTETYGYGGRYYQLGRD